MSRIIREAKPSDVADIMTVMDAAKGIMRQSGNMHQWGEGYPSEAVVTADMERNGGFVIEDDGKIVGYFAFLPSPEPTYSKIYDGMERVLCPRVHFKLIIIDSTIAYVGSANLTGAGMGMKSPKKRNFEAGILTDDPEMLDAAIEQFDNVWIGKFCKDCGRREYCSDPIK